MQFILCCMPLNFKDMEEFVLDFVEEGSITEIDVVMEVTGLTHEEVKSCSEILVIDYEQHEKEKIIKLQN